MPKSTPTLFKKSLLAVAVVSVSACSTMPQGPDIDLSVVGSGIVKAGKVTADAGRKTWNTTTYLLGFSDSLDSEDSKSAGPSDEQLLVENTDIDQELPIVERATIDQALPMAMTPAVEVDNQDGPAIVQAATANTEGQPADADTVLASAAGQTSARQEDLVHEVGARETLWDIAKLTTGDATNWHVLADVNDLEQNATVFPGQQLLIPANMVKPNYDAPVIGSTATLDDNMIAGQADSLTPQPIDTGAAADSAVIAGNLDIGSSDATDDAITDVTLAAMPFDLNDRETLWDFAKRTTGDATNWQAIAKHNNFSERQAVTVRPGQTIYVPETLVRDELSADLTVIKTYENDTSVAASTLGSDVTDTVNTIAKPVIETTSATVASLNNDATIQGTADPQIVSEEDSLAMAEVAAALPDDETQLADAAAAIIPSVVGSSTLDETQDIQIVEATYKTDDILNPVTTGEELPKIIENANIPSEIMVSGTYYPKAVYNNADFSSSLLMRVSPGTTLQVSRAIGTWFEVETDKGVGYVHQRDIK